MGKTISLMRADIEDLAIAMEFLGEAFPQAKIVEINRTCGAVVLGKTTLLLYSAPTGEPRVGTWFGVTVLDLTRITKLGRKFACKKLSEHVPSVGMREVTYVVTKGLIITFRGPRLCRLAINKRRSQAATNKTGKRRLPQASSV